MAGGWFSRLLVTTNEFESDEAGIPDGGIDAAAGDLVRAPLRTADPGKQRAEPELPGLPSSTELQKVCAA